MHGVVGSAGVYELSVAIPFLARSLHFPGPLEPGRPTCWPLAMGYERKGLPPEAGKSPYKVFPLVSCFIDGEGHMVCPSWIPELLHGGHVLFRVARAGGGKKDTCVLNTDL